MDYNTDREHLILPEYGRTIQQMVNYCMTISNRHARQVCAETIVALMAQKCPPDAHGDGEKVLWDHLARMSRYELDVDYPTEITSSEDLAVKPDRLPYSNGKVYQRHYGYLLEQATKRIAQLPEGPERQRLIILCAMQMKKDLFYHNREVMHDQKIADDLARYTDGAVAPDDPDVLQAIATAVQAKGSAQNGAPRRKRRG